MSARAPPPCQCCRTQRATGLFAVADTHLVLACSDACGKAWLPRSARARDARSTFGFLVDRNVIPLLKPHAGLLHQYIAYKGFLAAVPASVGTVDAFWAHLAQRMPLMTAHRFMAGLVWPDMPLARSDVAMEELTPAEEADLTLYLARSLTRDTMDAFATSEDTYVSFVPEGVPIPYLRGADARVFRKEPSPSWALSFGAALTFPDLFPKSVQGRNSVYLHLHPAMQTLHMMRGRDRETVEYTLTRARHIMRYLLTRILAEGDAFLLGVLVHMLSDGFSRAHTVRHEAQVLRLIDILSLESDTDSAEHAAHEGADAIFANQETEEYTPEYQHIMPAVTTAVGYLFSAVDTVIRAARGEETDRDAAWHVDAQWADPRASAADTIQLGAGLHDPNTDKAEAILQDLFVFFRT